MHRFAAHGPWTSVIERMPDHQGSNLFSGYHYDSHDQLKNCIIRDFNQLLPFLHDRLKTLNSYPASNSGKMPNSFEAVPCL